MILEFAIEIIGLGFAIVAIGLMAHWAGGNANPEKIMSWLKRS